jgi:hypothetical protein
MLCGLINENESDKTKSNESRKIVNMTRGPMKMVVKIIFVTFNDAIGL